jgi:5-methyltetrahydrofolate--homocysteine methyltransferase
MLDTLVSERWLTARAVIGIFPAAGKGDDIEVFSDPRRSNPLVTLHHLRQQKVKPAGQPQLCLADFVAPRDAGIADYIGAFAVTSGIGIERHVARFEAAHDDYSAILLKALADRLAEGLAEMLHERVRREFWGYAPDERLSNERLIGEEYRGIRPAPGYPACPDHTEKAQLWRLLDAEAATGIRLTESYAMYPAAAVSGWYLSHPEARYFAVGPIGSDQLEDYARRKGISVADARRWLAPVLGRDAEADAA